MECPSVTFKQSDDFCERRIFHATVEDEEERLTTLPNRNVPEERSLFGDFIHPFMSLPITTKRILLDALFLYSWYFLKVLLLPTKLGLGYLKVVVQIDDSSCAFQWAMNHTTAMRLKTQSLLH